MNINPQTGRRNSLGIGRGRGVPRNDLPTDKCPCQRPHSVVLCNACGYWMKGRVRYSCPFHPQTVFLFDITQCPRCKSNDFMLTELTK